MNNNSNLHQLLGDEGIFHKQLKMNVADLELELDNLKGIKQKCAVSLVRLQPTSKIIQNHF